jgi:hypothetical protein
MGPDGARNNNCAGEAHQKFTARARTLVILQYNQIGSVI